MKRVPPSKTTKARIEELLGTGISEGSPLSELVRLSVEHSNGYRQARLKTSEGRVEYAVPQVRLSL